MKSKIMPIKTPLTPQTEEVRIFKKYAKIAAKVLGENVHILFSPLYTDWCCCREEFVVPYPLSSATLFVCLHEFSHALLGHYDILYLFETVNDKSLVESEAHMLAFFMLAEEKYQNISGAVRMCYSECR